jgi:hypothetical protein
MAQGRLQLIANRTSATAASIRAAAASAYQTTGDIAMGTYQATELGVKDIRQGEGFLGERIKYVSDKVSNKIQSTATMFDKISEKLEKIEKIPSFYKIMFLIFFYIFFYKIFYDIGIFFGLNNLELIIYMTWFGMILFFASFISVKRSRLK